MSTSSVLSFRLSYRTRRPQSFPYHCTRTTCISLAHGLPVSFSFPDGYKCWRTSDGSVEINLANLGDHPAFDLFILHWEMETNAAGEPNCKASSLCESNPQTLEQHVPKQTFKLPRSKKADADKSKIAELALSDFKNRHNGQVPSGTLCVIGFLTKVSSVPSITSLILK
jgi:hypothetical protein